MFQVTKELFLSVKELFLSVKELFLSVKELFQTTPGSLSKEIDQANQVFLKTIERLKKIKLKSVTKIVDNSREINRLNTETDKLVHLNSQIDARVSKLRNLVE